MFTLPMKLEQTEGSDLSAYKIQTLGNHPQERIQQVLGLFPGVKLTIAWQ